MKKTLSESSPDLNPENATDGFELIVCRTVHVHLTFAGFDHALYMICFPEQSIYRPIEWCGLHCVVDESAAGPKHSVHLTDHLLKGRNMLQHLDGPYSVHPDG